MRITRFAEVPFIEATPLQAVEQTLNAVARFRQGDGGADIHLLNAYSVALAQASPEYRESVQSPSLNFADGKPLSWFGRVYGGTLSQVRGPQFFEDVIDRGCDDNIHHYFLGSTEETLEALVASLRSKYPNMLVAGTCSPPFRVLTKDEVAEQDEDIRISGADIVWVGLGTPKQDHEARRLCEQGFVAVAVGAAFDFSSGLKSQAPKIIQGSGFEWVYRLICEPRRLWKRYLWGNSVFLKTVLIKIITK